MYAQKDVLVAMALPEEGGQLLIDAGANVLYTGLGKVNAAYTLTREIYRHRPLLVLNLGTAGSKLFSQKELVACNRFIQRDMNVSALGFKPYATPFEDSPLVITHKTIVHHLPVASCATGDSFETNHSQDVGEVVDMEAYALGKVCWFEKIDFACVKYISDGADENASHHWQDSLKSAGQLFLEVYRSILNPAF
jgi:adenosylhomocysteine nucleosidase